MPCGCADPTYAPNIPTCAEYAVHADDVHPHVSAWPTLTATSDQSVNMFEAELICKELRRVIIVACLVMSGGQLASFLDTTQRAFSKHQTIFLFGRKAKCLCDLVLFTL